MGVNLGTVVLAANLALKETELANAQERVLETTPRSLFRLNAILQDGITPSESREAERMANALRRHGNSDGASAVEDFISSAKARDGAAALLLLARAVDHHSHDRDQRTYTPRPDSTHHRPGYSELFRPEERDFREGRDGTQTYDGRPVPAVRGEPLRVHRQQQLQESVDVIIQRNERNARRNGG